MNFLRSHFFPSPTRSCSATPTRHVFFAAFVFSRGVPSVALLRRAARSLRRSALFPPTLDSSKSDAIFLSRKMDVEASSDAVATKAPVRGESTAALSQAGQSSKAMLGPQDSSANLMGSSKEGAGSTKGTNKRWSGRNRVRSAEVWGERGGRGRGGRAREGIKTEEKKSAARSTPQCARPSTCSFSQFFAVFRKKSCAIFRERGSCETTRPSLGRACPRP